MNALPSYELHFPKKVIFGCGSVEKLKGEAQKLKASQAIIITTAGRVKGGLVPEIVNLLNECRIKTSIFDGVVVEPTKSSILKCLDFMKGKKFDLVIGVGGGSALDTAKIVSVLYESKNTFDEIVGINKVQSEGLPTILIPTTSGSGSEGTFIAIFTDEKEKKKKAVVSPYLLPFCSIIDPALTLSLPADVTANTGMDAFIHALEAFVSKRSNPITDHLAISAMELVIGNLKKAIQNKGNAKHRCNLSLGSLLAGIAETNAGVGAVHALAYPLQDHYKIPHGKANAIMLPYVLKYNIKGNKRKFQVIAKLLKQPLSSLPEYFLKLNKQLKIPTTLQQCGVQKSDLNLFAQTVAQNTRLLNNNPQPLSEKDILKIYLNAYS